MADESAIRTAFAERDPASISSLHFGNRPSGSVSWLAGDDWWIQ
jgi:hypothetical protein